MACRPLVFFLREKIVMQCVFEEKISLLSVEFAQRMLRVTITNKRTKWKFVAFVH